MHARWTFCSIHTLKGRDAFGRERACGPRAEQRGSSCPPMAAAMGHRAQRAPHKAPIMCAPQANAPRARMAPVRLQSGPVCHISSADLGVPTRVSSLHPSANESCTDKSFCASAGQEQPWEESAPFILLAALRQSQACSSPPWGGIGGAGHNNTNSALNQQSGGLWDHEQLGPSLRGESLPPRPPQRAAPRGTPRPGRIPAHGRTLRWQ